MLRVSNQKAVSVQNASTVVLLENLSRRYALFVNDSDTKIYLFIGEPASSAGIPLLANGGSYEMSDLVGNVSWERITAYCSVASKNLNVLEMCI